MTRTGTRTLDKQLGHTIAAGHRLDTVNKRGIDIVTVTDIRRIILVGPFQLAVVTHGIVGEIERHFVARTRHQRIGKDCQRQRIHAHMNRVAMDATSRQMLNRQRIRIRISIPEHTIHISRQWLVIQNIIPFQTIAIGNRVFICRREQTNHFVLTYQRIAHGRYPVHHKQRYRRIGRINTTALFVREFEMDRQYAVFERTRIAQRIAGIGKGIGGSRIAHRPPVRVSRIDNRSMEHYRFSGADVGRRNQSRLGTVIDMYPNRIESFAPMVAHTVNHIHRIAQSRVDITGGTLRTIELGIEERYMQRGLRLDTGCDFNDRTIAYRRIGRTNVESDIFNHRHDGIGRGTTYTVAVETGDIIRGIGRRPYREVRLRFILIVNARHDNPLAHFPPFVSGHDYGRIVKFDLRQYERGSRTENGIGPCRDRRSGTDYNIDDGIGTTAGRPVDDRQDDTVAGCRRMTNRFGRITRRPPILIHIGTITRRHDFQRGRIVGTHSHGRFAERITYLYQIRHGRNRLNRQFHRITEYTSVGSRYGQVIIPFVEMIVFQAILGIRPLVESAAHGTVPTVCHRHAADMVGHLQRIVKTESATANRCIGHRIEREDAATLDRQFETVGHATRVTVERRKVQHDLTGRAIGGTRHINGMQDRIVVERTVAARRPMRTATVNGIARQRIADTQYRFAVGTGFRTYFMPRKTRHIRRHTRLGRAHGRIEHTHCETIVFSQRRGRIITQNRIGKRTVAGILQNAAVLIPEIGISGRGIVIADVRRNFHILRTVFELTERRRPDRIDPRGHLVVRVNFNRQNVGLYRIVRACAIVAGHNLGIDVIIRIATVNRRHILEGHGIHHVVFTDMETVEIPMDFGFGTGIGDLGLDRDVFQRADIVFGRIIICRTVIVCLHETDFHNRIKSFYHTHRHGVGRYGRIGRERAHRTVAMEYGVYFVAVLQAALRYRIATGNEIAVAEPFDIPTV